jgi:hypothetical protein
MRRRSTNRSLTIALYLNAALMAGVLLVLASRGGNTPSMLPAAYGQNQLPIGGGAGVFIVPAQFAPSVFGCYIMDIDAQTLCAYQFFPVEKQLRLMAARTFKYDRRLGHYNSDKLTPEEVKELVEQEQQGNRVLESNKEHPSPEKKTD